MAGTSEAIAPGRDRRQEQPGEAKQRVSFGRYAPPSSGIPGRCFDLHDYQSFSLVKIFSSHISLPPTNAALSSPQRRFSGSFPPGPMTSHPHNHFATPCPVMYSINCQIGTLAGQRDGSNAKSLVAVKPRPMMLCSRDASDACSTRP